MLEVLLIAQKFEHISLLTETRKVELCRCCQSNEFEFELLTQY